MFRVPSSTPPSTPGRSSRFHGPTTTPAGPPPDESYGDYEPTSTPAGPPPMNSLFGESQQPSFARPGSYSFDHSHYNGSFPESSPPRHGLFEGKGSMNIGTTTFGRPGSAQRSRPNSRPASGAFGNSFRVPSSPPQQLNRGGQKDGGGDDDDDMDADGYEEEEDDDMDDEEYDDYADDHHQLAASRRPKTNSRLSQSVVSRASTNDLDPGPTLVHAGRKQTHFDLVGLAKGLAPPVERATLQEPDSVILDTERVLDKVNESLHSDTPEIRAGVLGDAARELLSIWQAASKGISKTSLSSSRSGGSAGLANASRLASLLLNIHHPPPVGHGHNQPSSALSLVPRGESRQYTPVPKLLLDWLNHTYSGVSEVELVLRETRGYSRHHSFWEAVHASAVRGNFSQTVQLLQGANLEVAESAQTDGLGETGYTGANLRYANEAVRSAIDLLRECPAVASDDWDIKGHDWTIFRSRVHQVYINLQEFAEGNSVSRQGIADHFQAPNFHITQSQATFRLSVASRKAESRVPWTVYEELRRLYQLLLGNEEEILQMSADWIEATLGLTIWWNGEEDDIAQGSFAVSRRSLMRSQRVRQVDITPVSAYCQRLASSFAAVVENSDEEFGVNVTDRFEVGVACVLDDNIEGALYILRGWSLTAATAVAEVASAGGWYKPAAGLLGGFDKSDLMVLSYNEQPRTGATKDDLQIAYSEALSTKGTLTSQEGQSTKEGWELAVQVLSRLDDSITASQRIENIINDLPLDSVEQVDRITQLCYAMNLNAQAISIALKYADHLRANTHNYGDTLLYYARAHSAQKIQEVLRVLVAHCLIKSTAYPPVGDLDTSLRSLITTPKQTLTRLAAQDTEAARILSQHLSGYATIRKFYDLRDSTPSSPSLTVRRQAAAALLVIIGSAASSIQGGLYDADTETVVAVDVLLPLLGESLVFLGQPKRVLTLRHLYDLLAAIEDWDTSGALVKAQCEEVLATTLAAAWGERPPEPRSALQKSVSALSGSTFSLIGSQDFSQDGQSVDSSAVLVKGGKVEDGRRGWDWRRGFPRGATGTDLLRVLRLGVAREIARAFAEGEVAA
ncbi:hypothetical protein E8E12_002860 [Didymella heteroderae]|uniref:Nuclear pore complex protein Nup85 n=1 Tax=Didymella heteroderae TaxID=1769908 RepID=A0A9P4WPG6_9PLEO|nr:hypothetical protein E8E12_002860 [Didymella heteroderae]